jgi:predicted ATPase
MVRKLNIEALEDKFPTMPRPESKYLSRIPTLMILSGHTGSGKSTNAVELIRMLRREGAVTRVFVISPTVVSNQIYGAICTDKERDWKIHLGDDVFEQLKRIEADVEADAENYRKDLEYVLARKKYCSGEELTAAEETLLEHRSYVNVKPVRPSPALFVDDCVSSKMFSNRVIALELFSAKKLLEVLAKISRMTWLGEALYAGAPLHNFVQGGSNSVAVYGLFEFKNTQRANVPDSTRVVRLCSDITTA